MSSCVECERVRQLEAVVNAAMQLKSYVQEYAMTTSRNKTMRASIDAFNAALAALNGGERGQRGERDGVLG